MIYANPAVIDFVKTKAIDRSIYQQAVGAPDFRKYISGGDGQLAFQFGILL